MQGMFSRDAAANNAIIWALDAAPDMIDGSCLKSCTCSPFMQGQSLRTSPRAISIIPSILGQYVAVCRLLPLHESCSRRVYAETLPAAADTCVMDSAALVL
eukprot:5426210-Pleurochrysis_carterae.AAC.2